MELKRIIIKKSEFDTIPENDRLFIVLISACANEVSMLHKFIAYSNYHVEDETINTAQNVQSFFLIKLLAGKLYEGFEIIRKDYFGSALSREHDVHLSKDSKIALTSLKSYFSRGDNLIKLIRNKFSFHYDSTLVREQLDGIPDEEDLELYLASNHGNSLYALSHIVSSYALFNEVDDSDHWKAVDTIFKEVLNAATNFLVFAEGILTVIWVRHRITAVAETDIYLQNVQKIDTIKLPYFVIQ